MSRESEPARTPFHRDVLRLDAPSEIARIERSLHKNVIETLGRKGVVLGVSGGVDSAVCLHLAVRALGPERVIALLLPERESNPESATLGGLVCEQVGVEPIVEDLTDALLGLGCYQRRNDSIRAIIPDFDDSCTLKITLPAGLLEKETLNVFSVTVVTGDGLEIKKRLRGGELRQIVASTNFKQRARAAMLYYYADLHDYAVLGTPPKNEQDLGFFVKHGDGAMDVKPIAHLYKSQVYQLAECLDVPEEICSRPPTSDTYPAGSTQEEFFFRIPFVTLDLIWFAWSNGVGSSDAASELDLEAEQVERVYRDFSRKVRSTEYLRTAALGTEVDSKPT